MASGFVNYRDRARGPEHAARAGGGAAAPRALLFRALSTPLSAPLYPCGTLLLRSASGSAKVALAPRHRRRLLPSLSL